MDWLGGEGMAEEEEEERGGEGGHMVLLPLVSGELGHEELLGEVGGVGGIGAEKSAADSWRTWVSGTSLLS